MPHVVTGACSGCRFTECVSVCPVACFHIDEQMTYINPAVCIDCAGCIPVCPVNAIFDSIDIPDELAHWIAINDEYSQTLSVVSQPLAPLPGAETKRRTKPNSSIDRSVDA